MKDRKFKIFCIIVSLAVLYVLVKSILPFFRFLDHNKRKYQDAINTLNSETCTDMAKKAKGGQYAANMCASASSDSSVSPTLVSLIDTVHYWNICSGGECIVIAKSIFNNFFWYGALLLVIGFFIFA